MKTFTSICFVFLFSFNAFSQRSQITMSDEFKVVENDFRHRTVSHSVYHNNAFFTVNNSSISKAKWLFTKLYDVKFSITLSKFDGNMNTIKEFEIEQGERMYGPVPPELILFNQSLYLAYFKIEDDHSFSLYLSAIDETSLTLKGPQKICTIRQENVGIFKIDKVIEAGLAYFSISADNTKMLVASKSSANVLQTYILDNALNVVKQGSLPVKFTEYTVPSAVLTPDNKVCLILKSDKETAILCANADGKKVEVKYNSPGNQTPYFTRAKLSKDGKSIYIYSTSIPVDQVEKEQKWCNGLLISQLDCNTFKISKPLSYEFTPEFIQSVSQKGGGIRHKREYLMYTFDPELHELSDGSVAIVGSPETTTVNTSSTAPDSRGQSRITTRTTLNVGPVVAFYPGKNGRAFEYVIIPRRINLSKGASSGTGAVKIVQSPTVSHSSAGFISSVIGDEIVILYNDNVKNIARAEDQKPVTTDGNGDLELVEAVISKDKKLAYRKLISETQKKRYTYFLGNSIASSSSSIIFPLGKEGASFNARNIFYTNWCFITMK